MKYIPAITKILKKYGIKNAAVFGSVVRGEAKKGSDLDILVEYPAKMSIFDQSALHTDLEEAVGIKVDLVNKNKIKPSLKPYIDHDSKINLAL